MDTNLQECSVADKNDSMRLTVVMNSEAVKKIDVLARQRFGGNRSEAVRFALDIGVVVVSDSSTLGIIDAEEALSVWCQTNGKKTTKEEVSNATEDQSDHK